MTNIVKDRGDLADVLRTMPFGKLMEVATELVEMNEEKEYDRDIKSPLGMAQTLSDWAEAQVE